MLLNIEQIDSAAMAGIHATIFSIIIGFISAYSLYIYSKINELIAQLLQEATKINTISFHGATLTVSKFQDIDFTDENKREEILKKLRLLSSMLEMHTPYDKYLLNDNRVVEIHLPTNPKLRGEEILGILQVIYSQYPIPVLGKTPVPFTNVNSARKWVKDTEYVLGSLDWVLRGNARFVQEYFDAASQPRSITFSDLPKEKIMEYRRRNMSDEQIARMLEEYNQFSQQNSVIPRRIYSVENYLQVMFSIKELLKSVQSHLAQVEARKPNKDIRRTYLVLSAIGFVSGVIFPSFKKDIDPIFFLHIPYLCYFIIFFISYFFIEEKLDSTK